MKKLLIIIAIIGIIIPCYSQKVKLVEGDLSILKGQKEIAVEFTYDDMIVGKEKKEADYIAEKKKDYNAKEPGRGEKWEKAWYADRKERFEPQFRELFSKHSFMSTVGEKPEYTLIFKTTRTEPGWNVGVMRAAARIDGEVWIVKSADPTTILAKLTVTNAPGRDVMGFDYETGVRIQEAYAKSGKEVGKLVASKTK